MYQKRFSSRPKPGMARPVGKTSWNQVADWYSAHLREAGEYQHEIIFPGALRLLAPQANGNYLDIACGEGSFARLVAQKAKKGSITGFDAAPKLIEYARQHPSPSPLFEGRCHFMVADAGHFSSHFPPASFDGATCLMAIQNIELFSLTFRETARVLKPGGIFILVMNHPCFRQPRQSGWGWDEERHIQYRRIDRYLKAYAMNIVAHPGSAPQVKTTSYHRPLSAYVQALTQHGLVIEQLEEWTSHKVSDSGPKAKAENIARQEIPLFLAIRARKR